MLTLLNIWGWCVANYRVVIIGGCIAILLSIVAFWAFCGKSRLERQIETRQPVIEETQTGANQAINAAINANVKANDAIKAANQIRANKQRNVSIDEAKRNMCRAYPELPECK